MGYDFILQSFINDVWLLFGCDVQVVTVAGKNKCCQKCLCSLAFFKNRIINRSIFLGKWFTILYYNWLYFKIKSDSQENKTKNLLTACLKTNKGFIDQVSFTVSTLSL